MTESEKAERKYAKAVANQLVFHPKPGLMVVHIEDEIIRARASLIEHNDKLLNAWTQVCKALGIPQDASLELVINRINFLQERY